MLVVLSLQDHEQTPHRPVNGPFRDTRGGRGKFGGLSLIVRGTVFGTLGALGPSHGADTVNGDRFVYGPIACLCLSRTDWVGGSAGRDRSLIVGLEGAGRAGERRGPGHAVRALA